jgi:hypothetical protein
LAWVSAAVKDASATAELFAGVAGAREVTGNPRRASSIEEPVDIRIGDLDVRLVAPRTEDSRYWAPLQRGPRLYSYALRVPDLEGPCGRSKARG